MQTTQVTAEQRQRLVALGFEVEDMAAANGPGWWEGSFRWMRYDTETGELLEFGNPGDEDEVWRWALQMMTQHVATS